jgi:diguanylate cyclase (GGDEF)-like protein/PAS domain S-box-containing protein
MNAPYLSLIDRREQSDEGEFQASGVDLLRMVDMVEAHITRTSSENSRVKNELARLRRKLAVNEFVLHNASVANVWIGRDARILSANAAACKLASLDQADLLKKSIYDIEGCIPADQWDLYWQKVKERGVVRGETSIRRSKGRLVPVSINSSYMQIGSDEYLIVFAIDISDRVRIERKALRSEERLRALAENIADVVCIVDRTWRFRYVSPSCKGVLGFSCAELMGKRVETILHPSDVQHMLQAIARDMDSTTDVIGPIEIRCRHNSMEKESEWLYFSLVARNRFHDSSVDGLVIVARDITGSKKTHDAAKSQDSRLIAQREQLLKLAQNRKRDFRESVLDALSAAVETLGVDRASYWSGDNESGLTCEMLVRDGKVVEPIALVQTYFEEHPELVRTLLEKNVCNLTFEDYFGSDSQIYQNLHLQNIDAILTASVWVQGRVSGVLIFSHSTSHRIWKSDELDFATAIATHLSLLIESEKHRIAEERIRQLAHFDTLTGLPNRNLLLDRVRQAIAHSNRLNRQMAIMFLDLDRFKIVNDTLGHDVGDQLLRLASQRLFGALREEDTLARQGGDEFIVILPGIKSPQDASTVAQKLIAALEEPFLLQGNTLHVKTSIGISICPADGTNMETLLRHADMAMYYAKELGGNRTQFFASHMNLKATDQMAMESSLRLALANDELELYYQPQVDHTGNVASIEALVRWTDPALGTVSPSKFVPLAEESDLIFALDEWVLNEACRQNKAWQKEGFPKIRIAVNLCARQFAVQGLPQLVSRILDKTGLEANYLELEITESILMQSNQSTLDVLHRLHSMGIALSIDDFGTGYSSLSYLKKYPVSKLKIDRSFVTDLSSDPDDQAITRAIIAMAHNLRLKVVAEGVETPEQYAFLREHRCDYIQGYLVCHPMPAAQTALLFQAGSSVWPDLGRPGPSVETSVEMEPANAK